ncbi:MAG: 4'-phosphopantetheinyl transferase family protein [Spirochaetota bacterium]
MTEPGQVNCFYVEYQDSPVLDSAGELLTVLDEDDLARYHRYTHSEKKAELLVSRLLVKSVMARFSGVLLQDVVLWSAPGGEPRLEIKGGTKFHLPRFSLAHTHGLVAVAFYGHGEVGVDVEDMLDTRRHLEAIAFRFFSEQEKAYFHSDENKTPTHFFTLWTLKEAIAKVQKGGILELLKDNLVVDGRVMDTKDAMYLEHQVLDEQYCFGIAVKGEKPRKPAEFTGISYARLHENLHR